MTATSTTRSTRSTRHDMQWSAWQWLWRIVVTTILLLVAAIAAFLTGLAGQRFGWLFTAVVFCGGFALLAWLLFGRGRRARIAAAVAAMTGVVVTVALVQITPLMPSALVAAFPEDSLPEGSALLDSSSSGGPMCFDYCPSVTRSYEAPGEPAEVRQAIAASLEAKGWDVKGGDRGHQAPLIATTPDRDVEAMVYVEKASEPSPESGSSEPIPQTPGYLAVQVHLGQGY